MFKIPLHHVAAPGREEAGAPARQYVQLLGLALGVVVIVAANFFLRSKLEGAPLPPYPVFADNRVPLTWRLLLPIEIGRASCRERV